MKLKLNLTLLFLICIGFTQAQNADKKWAVGLGGGLYLNPNQNNSTGIASQFYLSRYLSPSFDIRLKPTAGLNFDTFDLDNANFLLDLRYKFYNGKIMDANSRIQPYINAGVGYLMDNSATGINFDAGLGTKILLGRNVAMFVEAGYMHGINSVVQGTDRHDNFLKGLIGIEIAFGAPLDTDKDGVPDRRDKCPSTPLGIAVDADGCPLDSDGDGIPDYLDKCPEVPGFAKFDGCPDTDRDGIPDYIDKCPEVHGLAKFDGCPDTDSDGIPDSEDECPDLPGLAELKGCLDSDGDGVPDHLDKCPNTPKGIKVDKYGCPVDSDGDGLTDDIDQCPDAYGPIENMGCPGEKQDKTWLDHIKVTSIFFGTNSSMVTDYSKGRLKELISIMTQNPEYKIKISAFADLRGTERDNLQLSERRALSVIKYLETQGIAINRVIYEAMGQEIIQTNSYTDEALLPSRRAEFRLFK